MCRSSVGVLFYYAVSYGASNLVLEALAYASRYSLQLYTVSDGGGRSPRYDCRSPHYLWWGAGNYRQYLVIASNGYLAEMGVKGWLAVIGSWVLIIGIQLLIGRDDWLPALASSLKLSVAWLVRLVG